MNRCVIIGAGEIKDIDFLKSVIKSDDTIVCADAGYIYAQKAGLDIDCIIGDFDSSDRPEFENTISLPVKKDVTDTFFCVEEYIKKGYDNFLILGATGGRIDHTFANVQTLYYLLQHGCSGVIIDERNKIYLINDNHAVIKFDGYENISFFSFFVEVKGLEIKNALYELSSYDLKPNDPLCVSNSFIEKNNSANHIFFDNKCFTEKMDIIINKISGTLLVVESK